MILTHFLAFIAGLPASIAPAAGLLPVIDGGTSVAGADDDPAPVPRLRVRAAAPVLAVRGD